MVVWCCATANTKPRFQPSDDAEYCLYVKLSASAGLATKTSTAHNVSAGDGVFTFSWLGAFSLGGCGSDLANLADAEKAADGLDELGDRDRLRQISLATAFAVALF